jgi:hypothetical protein
MSHRNAASSSREEPAAPGTRENPGTHSNANSRQKPMFPGRAKWLSERLHERSWNKHDVFRFRGPHHKTVQKILDGRAVRVNVLPSLARALSAAPTSQELQDPQVRSQDIPQT